MLSKRFSPQSFRKNIGALKSPVVRCYSHACTRRSDNPGRNQKTPAALPSDARVKKMEEKLTFDNIIRLALI